MYDLLIIGAGPAGLTASLYASCFKLNHLIIGALPGGQMTFAPDIVNYPGFTEISGMELTDKMVSQVTTRGGQIVTSQVTSIAKSTDGFTLTDQTGKAYETKTIILATGVERRKLNVPGEMEYTAKGVQYCATCERFDYEDKITAVIGGANAAAQTAVQLSHAAKKVYIIHRGNKLRADPIWLSHIEENPLIEPIYNSWVVEIVGDGQKVTGVKLQSAKQTDGQGSTERELPLDRIFIEIGGIPGTSLLIPLGVKVDPGGFIEVDQALATSSLGIFAAGDVVSHKYSIEQISSAVGSGARAALSVFSYLKKQKAPGPWGASQATGSI